MTKELSVFGCGLADSREPSAILRDHKEVSGSHWVDVTESQGQIVLEDDVSGDLLRHYLIKKCDLLWHCGLCLRDFVYHILLIFVICEMI